MASIDPVRGRIAFRTALLILVNVPPVYHYLGAVTALSYVAFAMCLPILVRVCPPRYQRSFLVTILFVSLSLQIIALHTLAPIFDQGMDRDSAIVTWLDAFADHRFPYAAVTDRGNPISILPVIPLLAFPFKLLGNVGYLEIFSSLFLVLLLSETYRLAPATSLHAVSLFATAPLLFFEVIARSDLIANMALVVLLVFLLERSQNEQHKPNVYALGFILGCVLSTRLSFYPVIVTTLLFLSRRLPAPLTLRITVIAMLVLATFIVPFATWDPHTFLHFAPIGVNREKLGTSVLAQVGWPLITAVASITLGLTAKTTTQLYSAIAIVFGVVVIATWQTFWYDISYLQLIFVPMIFGFPREKLDKARRPVMHRTADRTFL